jgi:hypothetical protein
LKAVIDHPNALQIEYVMAHDAAVSALGKFLQFHREKLNAAQVYIYFFPIPRSMEKEAFMFYQMRTHFIFYSLLDFPFGLIEAIHVLTSLSPRRKTEQV